jgi:hypothetical protein
VAHPLLKAFSVRFLSGLAGSVLAGWVIFRWAVFDPGVPAFHCLTVGALVAGVLAAVRLSLHGVAVILVVVFGMGRLGLLGSMGWLYALSGLVLAAGVYLIALIFDMLGKKGLVFGKFIIVGPLLAGIYLALVPMVEFHLLTSNGVLRVLIVQAAVGLLVGDGAALGIEIAELPSAVSRKGRIPASGTQGGA